MRRFYAKTTAVYFYTGSKLKPGMTAEQIRAEIKQNRGNTSIGKALSANQLSLTQISLLAQNGVFESLPEEELIHTESSELSISSVGTILERLFDKYDLELSVNSRPEVYLVGDIKINYVTKPIPVYIIVIKSKIKNELLSGDEKAVEEVNRIFMRSNSHIKQGDLKTLALKSETLLELEGTMTDGKWSESLDEFYGEEDATIIREAFKRLNLTIPTHVYEHFRAGKYTSPDNQHSIGTRD